MFVFFFLLLKISAANEKVLLEIVLTPGQWGESLDFLGEALQTSYITHIRHALFKTKMMEPEFKKKKKTWCGEKKPRKCVAQYSSNWGVHKEVW